MPIFEYPTPRELPPRDLDAPKPVQEAIEAAHVAAETMEQASRELDAAKAAVDQADAADQAAMRTALAANEAAPEADAGPKARAALEAAERKTEAANENYRAAVLELTDLMIEHGDEWRAKLVEELEAERAAISAAFADIHARHAGYAGTERLISHLKAFEPSASGKRRNVWGTGGFFTLNRSKGRSGPETLQAKREEVERAIRRRGHFSINDDVFISTLIELEAMARGEKPATARVTSDSRMDAETGDFGKAA